jgi:hypothetical protein
LIGNKKGRACRGKGKLQAMFLQIEKMAVT